MFAQMYVRQLSDNVKRSNEQKRRQGKKTGRVDIGYIGVYETDENGKRKRTDIIPDPVKGPLIVQAYNLFATGRYSIKTLTKEMQLRGLTGKERKPIARSMLHYCLSNPFNYGEMRAKGEIIPHIYKPLISKDLFMRVQKLLHSRKKNPTKLIAKEYALRGLIRCANPECGCSYSPELKRGHLVYYSCTNAKSVCHRIYMKEETLLEPIYEVLHKLQLPQAKVDELLKSLKTSTSAKREYQQGELKRLRKQYDNLQTTIDGLVEKYARSDIDKEVYDRVLTSNKEKQRTIETQLANHTDADETYHTTAAQVIDVARRAFDIFESSEPREKNQLLRSLLQNVQADGKTLLFTLRKPFDTLVSLHDQPIELAVWDDIRTKLETIDKYN